MRLRGLRQNTAPCRQSVVNLSPSKQALTQAAAKIPHAMSDEWVTIKEAARAANVDERTVRRWVASDKVISQLSGGNDTQIRLIRRDSLPLAGGGKNRPAIIPDQGIVIPGDQGASQSVILGVTTELQAIRVATEQQSNAMTNVMAAVTAMGERQVGAIERQTDTLNAIRELLERQEEHAKRQDEAMQRREEEIQALRAELAAQQKRRPWWMFWQRCQ